MDTQSTRYGSNPHAPYGSQCLYHHVMHLGTIFYSFIYIFHAQKQLRMDAYKIFTFDFLFKFLTIERPKYQPMNILGRVNIASDTIY